jgi:hypothetical protein
MDYPDDVAKLLARPRREGAVGAVGRRMPQELRDRLTLDRGRAPNPLVQVWVKAKA